MMKKALIFSIFLASTGHAQDYSRIFESLKNAPPSEAFETTGPPTYSWMSQGKDNAFSEALLARAQRDIAVSNLARAEERSMIMQQNHAYGIYESPRAIEMGQIMRDSLTAQMQRDWAATKR